LKGRHYGKTDILGRATLLLVLNIDTHII